MTGLVHGFTLKVKRLPKPATDRFGNPYPPIEFTIPGWAAAPAGSSEIVNGQQTVITQDTLYGPYDADVRPTDTVEVPEGQPIDAGDHQVDGKTQRWKNPFTGREFGCVVRLTRAEG